MKISKIFKFIFNRFVLVSFAIVVEIAFIVLSFTFWQSSVPWLNIVVAILGVILFLSLISKHEIPELKIPWLVAFMIFPVLGITLYFLIANNMPTKSHMKIIGKSREDAKKFMAEKTDISLLPDSDEIGIENYLGYATQTYGSYNNSCEFFDDGEKYFESLIDDIKVAEKFIFLEYFIIDDGKMWQTLHSELLKKVKENVQVKMLYDDIGSAGKIANNCWKKLQNEGIDCRKFNSFKPFISGLHNNRDHRKLAVIDGIVGYTGGVNIADEYINQKSAFGQWKDSAIRIEGPEVKNMTALFLGLFDVSQKHLSDYEKYLNISSQAGGQNGFIHFFGTGPNPKSKELIAENNLLNMISSAKQNVFITTPYLILDHNLTTALRNAALKGVDVRIVVPKIPDKKIVYNMTLSSFEYLIAANVKIYEYSPGFIHSKQVLIDDKLAFVGTINMDYRSLVHHYECGAMLFDCDCLKDIKQDFLNLFAVSELQTKETLKINKFTKLINSIFSVFRPLF